MAAAAVFSVCFSGCDDGATDEEAARGVPCNLADEACAARPAAAEALALLASMGVDPGEVDVELVEAPRERGGDDPAEAHDTVDDLKVDTAPQEVRPGIACNESPSCTCCCVWGDAWGCGCTCD